MSGQELQTIYDEMGAAIDLSKCQKCGCLRETIDQLTATLPFIDSAEASALLERVKLWTGQIQPAQYACLGCTHCYPAVAQNAFSAAFPGASLLPLACDFQVSNASWPSVVGEYSVVDANAHVAISTLGSSGLTEELAKRQPKGLAIAGKTETENIGIDKVVKNIISNPAIQYLILAGKDPAGHWSGQTLLALSENGIDANGRVIGSTGKRPILRNVTAAQVELFRKQVEVVDLRGIENADEIAAHVEALAPQESTPCG